MWPPQEVLLSLSLSQDASQQFPVAVGKSQFIELLQFLTVLVKLCARIQALPRNLHACMAKWLPAGQMLCCVILFQYEEWVQLEKHCIQ